MKNSVGIKAEGLSPDMTAGVLGDVLFLFEEVLELVTLGVDIHPGSLFDKSRWAVERGFDVWAEHVDG